MTHRQPDHGPSSAPEIPVPAVGAGSADLRTISDDPAELRRLLQLAQERLAFYESFDRIVGENVRRSGELMLERIGLREQAEAQAAEAARERTEREAERAAMTERYRGLLRDLTREATTLQTSLDEMLARLRATDDALDLSGERGSATTAPASADSETDLDQRPAAVEASPLPGRTANTAAMEAGGTTLPQTVSEPTSQPDPEPADDLWDTPQVVELIAHGVPRAADALSLQRYLGGLDQVAGVEAREFAEGVLRLQLTTRAPIPEADIERWPNDPGVRVLHHQANVIEIACTSPGP